YDIQPATIHKQVQDRFETTGYRTRDARAGRVALKMEISSLPDVTLKIAELEKKMWAAADSLDYETAAACRDLIASMKNAEA
ncbi:MAG TPA: UvrB/UvrC motif-containing protein, partial [bacterium]|nr:UvrB/UvrC motif-containing protein [bacterium]